MYKRFYSLVLPIVIISFLVIGLTSLFLYQLNKNKAKKSNDPTNELVRKLNEVKSQVDFPVLLPAINIKNEILSEITVANEKTEKRDDQQAQTQGSDKPNTVFLVYKLDSKKIYEVAGSKREIKFPEGKNTKVKDNDAVYYSCTEQKNPEECPSIAESEKESVPSSMLFWKSGNVIYTISNFDTLSQDQLIKIANSMN
jgi:hypothetical protein